MASQGARPEPSSAALPPSSSSSSTNAATAEVTPVLTAEERKLHSLGNKHANVTQTLNDLKAQYAELLRRYSEHVPAQVRAAAAEQAQKTEEAAAAAASFSSVTTSSTPSTTHSSPRPKPYLPSTASHSTPHPHPPPPSTSTPPTNTTTTSKFKPPTLSTTIVPENPILTHARATLKQHIAYLHAYNEIKDVAQGLIGMVAEQRGVRVVDCMGEFGVEEGD